LKSKRKPKILVSDSGSEFINKQFKNYLNDQNIKLYIMRNTEVKSAVVERFIRTIKDKIFKVIYVKKNKKFIDKIPSILKTYNNTIHSRTLYKPVDVNCNNQKKVFLNLYKNHINIQKPNYKPGDRVRILKIKHIFQKGYISNYSQEIFIIKSILQTIPIPRYILKDYQDNTLIGSFYEKELVKVTNG